MLEDDSEEEGMMLLACWAYLSKSSSMRKREEKVG